MNHEPWTDWLVQEPGSWIHNIFLRQLSWSLTARPWKGKVVQNMPFQRLLLLHFPGYIASVSLGDFSQAWRWYHFFQADGELANCEKTNHPKDIPQNATR